MVGSPAIKLNARIDILSTYEFEFITFLVNNILYNYVDLYRDLNSVLINLFLYLDMMLRHKLSLISYYYGEWVLPPCMSILQIVWIEFQHNFDFYFIIVCCKSFYIVIL
jgi:hypothetical protein